MKDKGYIHLYTGNGKGKTTAAFGLVLRAVCAGKNVYVGQFVKSMAYNENRLAQLLGQADPTYGRLTIELLGLGCFIDTQPTAADAVQAQRAWTRCSHILKSDEYDVIVLDELCIALSFNLIPIENILHDLQSRNPSTEVVITGRYAPQALITLADLVTEMREVKHYYKRGVLSRNGIDK